MKLDKVIFRVTNTDEAREVLDKLYDLGYEWENSTYIHDEPSLFESIRIRTKSPFYPHTDRVWHIVIREGTIWWYHADWFYDHHLNQGYKILTPKKIPKVLKFKKPQPWTLPKPKFNGLQTQNI
jgi:hypothetical protein